MILALPPPYKGIADSFLLGMGAPPFHCAKAKIPMFFVMEDGEAVGVSDSRKDGAPAAVIDGGKRITSKPKQAPGGFSHHDEHAGEGGRETKEHHEHHGAQCGDSDRDSNGVPRCIGKGFGRRRRDSM